MRASPDRRLTLAALALAVALAPVASANEPEAAAKPANATTSAKPASAVQPAKPVNANVTATPKPATNATKPANANANKSAGPNLAKNGSGARTPVRLAASNGAGAPVVVPVSAVGAPAPGSTLAHLDDHLTYQYNALGRRDPFQALVGGGFVPMDQGGEAPPDIGGLKVVGVVWGATDQFALVEDARGSSFVLRKGDKVMNGFVEGLKRDGVIVNVTADGQSQTVVLPLTKKGEQK